MEQTEEDGKWKIEQKPQQNPNQIIRIGMFECVQIVITSSPAKKVTLCRNGMWLVSFHWPFHTNNIKGNISIENSRLSKLTFSYFIIFIISVYHIWWKNYFAPSSLRKKIVRLFSALPSDSLMQQHFLLHLLEFAFLIHLLSIKDRFIDNIVRKSDSRLCLCIT